MADDTQPIVYRDLTLLAIMALQIKTIGKEDSSVH